MSVSSKVNWRSVFSLQSLAYIAIGVFFATLGLQGFLVPNNFIDGGVTGISILVTSYFDIHISLLLAIINLPFVFMGYKKIGKTFAVQALIAVMLLAAAMYLIQFSVFTNDRVLIAVFGGFFTGLGIGFVIKGGGVIDGFDVIGEYTGRKTSFSSGEIILALNILMILGAAFEFGIESAMYSILVYFVALKTTNYVVDGFEEFTALTIVSREHDLIKELIVNDFGKALTVYKGVRGYLPGSNSSIVGCDIIMVVVTRLEIYRIKEAVMKIDPKAFLFMNSINEVKGGVIKQTKITH